MNYDAIPLGYSEQQLQLSRKELEGLMDRIPGIGSILITNNVADVVLDLLEPGIHAFKLSTMTGSLVDLGEYIARESDQQHGQFAIVENTDGRVISLRINADLVMTCISNRRSNLGMVLSAGRTTADALAKILTAPDTD